MIASNSDITLRRHGAEETLTLRDQILPVYAASHEHLIAKPWWSPQEFWDRLVQIYARTRDFELVSGWLDDTMVGYAFGSPKDDTGKMWPDIHTAFPYLEPDGPVYIFREFAVTPKLQRRGYGRLIHDELLRGRLERAAHLLVRKDNEPARAAYRRWGWTFVGEIQPFDDAPTLDAMALDLGTRR